MNGKVLLGFLGGLAAGAAIALLSAPEKGSDLRAKIVAMLKEKGVSKERFDEIIERVKSKVYSWSTMTDIEAAVDEALNDEKA